MTLEDALSVLSMEFDLSDPDDAAIVQDILTKVSNSAYHDGWAEGYSEGVESTESTGENW